MRNAVGIDEAADDSTQDIDCEGAGTFSLWGHDVAVTARIENETPEYAVAMLIEADDPSEIVDTLGNVADRSGRIDRREAAIAEQKSVVGAPCRTTRHVTQIVGAGGERLGRFRDIDQRKYALTQPKAVNAVGIFADAYDVAAVVDCACFGQE